MRKSNYLWLLLVAVLLLPAQEMAAKKKSDKAVRDAAKVLRDMSAEELRGKLAEQRQELMNARFKHAAAQLEKTSELKAMRKQVARIETVLNEKEQRA